MDHYSLSVTRSPYESMGTDLNSTLARLGPGTQQTEAPIIPGGEAAEPVHYSVTIIISVLVGVLFLLVYLQLILVIWFGYKLLTYQTVLLFDILLWAALRLTLYSFYFYHCCDLVNRIEGTFFGWLLVSFPACLQYFSLAVLVHYFGESIFKVRKKRQEMASLAPPYRKMRKYRVLCEFLWVAAVVIFLASSITFHFLIDSTSAKDKEMIDSSTRSSLVILRVVLLDGLFLFMGITLGVCIIIIYTTRAGKDVLEAQEGRKWVPSFISCLLIILFASRDIYSIVGSTDHLSISGYSVFVTDEGDYGYLDMNGQKHGYIAFFAVLMVWEVIPTYIIVFFFRVRLPRHHRSRLRLKPGKVRRKRAPHTNQKHFFENPNRYDENEQLLYHPVQRQGSTSTHVSIPSLTGSTPLYPHLQQQYGSTNGVGQRPTQHQHSKHYSINNSHHHGNSHPVHASVMPGTTPPQLFTSPSFFTDQ